MQHLADSRRAEQPWSYDDWQREIAAAFLAARPDPPPVVLFLDDEEAHRLWPSLQRPGRDLGAAVSEAMSWGRPDRLFDPIAAEVGHWYRGPADQPPPCLPVLAASVLAASRMIHDHHGPMHAYYLRLAQLLRPEANAETVRIQLAQTYGAVAAMWRVLHEWISARSDLVGISTIRSHHHYTQIGYPLSQALARSSDRQRLTSFFHAARVQTLGVPDPPRLLGYLRVWASRPRGLSPQFLRALRHTSVETLLSGLVHRLATDWDGHVRAAGGRRRLELRAAVDIDSWSCYWTVREVHGIDEDTLTLPDGGILRLSRADYGRLYRLEGELPAVARGLADGLTAIGTQYVVECPQRDVIVLREDPHTGHWISEPSLEPFDEHLLAVRPSRQAEMEAALATAGDPGWRVLRQPPDRTLLPGWVIYRHVTLSNPKTFELAASALSPGLAWSLRPDPPPRPRLVEGLPVAGRLGSGHYLVGGEPDLLLPVGAEPREVEASLDGVAQSPPFHATGFPIPLRGHELAPGRHEILADGARLVFHLHERSPTPALEGPGPTPGTLGPGITGQRSVPAPEEEPCPHLVRRGTGEAWILDSRGAARRLEEQARPAWMASRGMPESCYYEVLPGPGDSWLVEIRRGNCRPPRRLQLLPPKFSSLDSESAALWQQLDRATSGSTDALWQGYLTAWRTWAAHGR